MAAHNKPLRWQNSDEAQAHLSTTGFHMQVAATSSHRSRRLPVLPYQSLARSSGGELTGSEQSVRQSARLARHTGKGCPLSHTRRVNFATAALPRVVLIEHFTKIVSLQMGLIYHSPRKRMWQKHPCVRAYTHCQRKQMQD